jgi:hypothetical protein
VAFPSYPLFCHDVKIKSDIKAIVLLNPLKRSTSDMDNNLPINTKKVSNMSLLTFFIK